MHSTLQAELRFTQILASNCRHCARNHLPRSFHSARRLRIPQPPHNNVTSVAGRAVGADVHKNEIRDEVPKERDSAVETASSDTPQTAKHEARPAVAEKAQNVYHGSPAKRRLRNRIARAVDPEYEPPEWFSDANIVLFHENRSPSQIEIVSAADLDRASPGEDPDQEPPDSNPASSNPQDGSTVEQNKSGSPKNESQTQSAEIPVVAPAEGPSRSQKRYALEDPQYQEVWRTARGLLKLPHDQVHQLPEADSMRNHLLLSFAGDGDQFLDDLVKELARDLGCDVMALDAQDIVELIKDTIDDGELTAPARLMSYDIFTEAFSDPSMKVRYRPPPEEEQEEDEDDEDDQDIPGLNSFGRMGGGGSIGLPMIVGRPVSIALKDLLGGPSIRSGSRDRSRFASMRSDKKSPTRGFEGVPAGLFRSLNTRRNQTIVSTDAETDSSKEPKLDQLREGLTHETGIPKGSLILHIKDLRAIQEVDMGHQFLISLFDEVTKRRKAGHNIIIVGTDSYRHEALTQGKLHDIQNGNKNEVSQNIVLTPGRRSLAHKLNLKDDRKRRIATINMRHLWEALKYRDPSILSHLKPGFWRRDFSSEISPADHAILMEKIWSHAHVQRLAVSIAGLSPKATSNEAGVLSSDSSTTQQSKPSIIAEATAHLASSDSTKSTWVGNERSRFPSPDTLAERIFRGQNEGEAVEGSSGDMFRQMQNVNDWVKGEASPEDARLRNLRSTVSKYEKKLMSGIIEAKNIKTTFNDVHMPVETIEALNTLTTLSLTRPDAFKYGVLASDKIPGLLLYGPPGTGKTLAAKAVAKESGATMLEVSAADINDMYVGEGEKNVKALFSLAKKLSPCVVFLDEADAIFSARGNQGRRVNHRELLNQFLKEWDGMSNDAGSAFIMVATNRPMDLDDAVLRRLPRRLLVDLPTEQDRHEILKIHLRHENLADDVNLATLAKNTPFYSGSDLKNAAVAAALNAVREENENAKHHTGDEPFQYPERRTLTAKHFEQALEEISASISEDMSSLRDIRKFDEQYGDKRGKKKKTPRLGFPTGKQQRDTMKVRE